MTQDKENALRLAEAILNVPRTNQCPFCFTDNWEHDSECPIVLAGNLLNEYF